VFCDLFFSLLMCVCVVRSFVEIVGVAELWIVLLLLLDLCLIFFFFVPVCVICW